MKNCNIPLMFVILGFLFLLIAGFLIFLNLTYDLIQMQTNSSSEINPKYYHAILDIIQFKTDLLLTALLGAILGLLFATLTKKLHWQTLAGLAVFLSFSFLIKDIIFAFIISGIYSVFLGTIRLLFCER